MSRLMTESLLRWRLNGRDMRTVLCSPGQERALLTGLLLTGRMIAEPEQVRSLRREDGLWLVEADTLFPDFPDLAERLESMQPVQEAPLPEGAHLLALQKALMAGGGKNGLHGALIDGGAGRVIARDIGRHNAIDKAVGLALERKMDLSQAILCVSGRLSLEMLAKAAAAGIPTLCAAKHAGTLCMEYAARWRMHVIQAE
ncbi:MAG: formate dehydrogenase accessory sulfurtransferase FdhD [Clostridia bacterium]|nr:formate dehydrogenase accessory sulfurtransferase FdhD [Clostridia bacterium]